MKSSIVLSLVAVVALAVVAQAEQPTVDSTVKAYEKVSGVSGNINSVGSDTLNNLMAMWSESFCEPRGIYSNVKFKSEGKGSSTAPPALIEGTAQLGPMSRSMKDEEIDKFEKKYGYKPTRVSVALDCVAIYVNKDNPIRGLTLDQIDCIFSQTRKCGFDEIKTWGQAGMSGDWTDKPISLYGRDTASGTYGFVKEHALGKGDFKDTVKQQAGSASVINSVASDLYGVGYAGIGYKTPDVRAIPLAKNNKENVAQPTFENALKGKYPLGRTLYVYVNKKPNEALPVHIKEFFKFVLSREGQEIVVKDGFGPLPAAVIEAQLKAIE